MSAADDAFVASDEESIIILTQFHTYPVGADSDYVLAQDVPGSTINSDLVLLDSQSTVDLFTNPEHIQNIRPTKKTIQVHCNSGTVATTTEADFDDTPVYFNSRGIANVLSLYRLGHKFRVTYDSSDCNGVFQVHKKQGVIEFKPTPKGLHALNLKDNPEAAFLLVNDADIQMPHIEHNQMHVNTVRENFDGFSCKQVEGATAARRLMGMVVTPSPRNFEGMVRLNMLKDCPITNDNIKNANTIFGTDLATIRGKTVRCEYPAAACGRESMGYFGD